MVQVFGGLLFAAGYILMSLEYFLHIDKSALALLLAVVLWLLIALTEPDFSVDTIATLNSDSFSIIVFLLASMTLVEVLAHYRFFDLIRVKLFALRLSDRAEFWLIGGITFCLSIVLNNLTTTIVMLQLARFFFRGKNFLLAASAIVISANASAFSPLGDVTTLMLWLSHKFSGTELVSHVFLPSVGLFFVSNWLLSRKLEADTVDEEARDFSPLTFSEKIIIGVVLASFVLPFLFVRLDLPAYFGVMTGLALVWVLGDIFRKNFPRPSHLAANIENLLQKVDISTLKFLIGILLSVGALEHLGILDALTGAVFGEIPSMGRLIVGGSILGIAAAFFDNIPLTAAAIQTLPVVDHAFWTLFALTIGTGGSLLVMGSAAGIVAMGIAQELTFVGYLRIATLPALAGYFSAIALWCLQYFVLGIGRTG